MAFLVNGEYLDEAAIREESELIRQRLTEEMQEESALSINLKAREWATENMIERVLLRQAAEAYAAAEPNGETGCGTVVLHESLTVGAQSDGKMEKLLAHITRHVMKPKRKEVGEFYQGNQNLFFAPECASASHIVKNVDEETTEAAAHEAITAAQAELGKGKPFAEVADQYSDCPGAGGALGWFARGAMVDEFETVVFGLQPGGVSGIFRSPFGFHIAVLHERKAAGLRPFSEVYGQIEAGILNTKKQDAVERFVDELRREATVKRVPQRKLDGGQ